jgi:hypothetical protein
MNWGKEIKIPGDKFSPPLRGGMTFHICDQCIKESICPQCHGGGKMFIKRGTAPGGIEVCDLCGGSGKFDYITL